MLGKKTARERSERLVQAAPRRRIFRARRNDWVGVILAGLWIAGGASPVPALADSAAKPRREAPGEIPAAPEAKPPVQAEDAGAQVLSFLKTVELVGGISAGWFYASNAGRGVSEDEPLVSNFLLSLASADRNAILGFEAAVGETSTPSLLSPPEPNRELKVEYASLAVRPFTGGELAVGLLKPTAGYEDTYTYNNRNIVLGVVASQQPYNAYGARITYSVAGLELNAGYYPKRLAEEEYAVPDVDRGAERSWEASLGGEVAGVSCRGYHYHLESLRNLTGAVLEYTLGNVYLALNADVWRWDRQMSGYYRRRHAVGVALYVSPGFGSFSLPVRLEYVNQGESRIYLDSLDTHRLWAVTVSPSYQLTEKSYARLEASYLRGKEGFANLKGRTKDDRIYLASELGYLF